jgi:hypothetical protein
MKTQLRTTCVFSLWLVCKTVLAANPPPTISPGSPSSPGTLVGSLTPTFNWNSANGATGYGLYIRDMTAAGTPIIYPNANGITAVPLTGTSLVLPKTLTGGHIYRWNMTSFSGSTEGSAVSGVLYFQTPLAVVSTPTVSSASGGSSAGTIAVTPSPIVIVNPPMINAPGSASSPGTVLSSLTPTFGWNSVNGATGYGLYIRDMTAPGTPLIYPNSYGTTYPPLTGTSLLLPGGYLVNGHIYRWNMTSFSGSMESSTASSVLYFQTPPAVVSAPVVNSPNSGTSAGTVTILPPTTISPGYASSPGMVTSSLTPVFSWNAASGAMGYGLYIRDMTAAGMPLIYPNSSGNTLSPLTGTSLTLPNGYLINGHTYRWNMTSFNGSTEILAASSVLYFQTPPAVVSTPTVTLPSSGSSVGTVTANSTPAVMPNSSSSSSSSPSSRQILGNSLLIHNISGQAMIATVVGNDGTTKTINIPAIDNNAPMCKLNAPAQQSSSGISYYSGVTAAIGVGAGGGDVSFTVSGDGSGQLTLTVGAAGVLRGSVYTTTTGQFGACWAPGANFGVSFAEGYVCLGTDGITLGADASPGGVVTGFSIGFKPVPPSSSSSSLPSSSANSSMVSSPQISTSALSKNQTALPALQSVATKSVVTSTPQSAVPAMLMLRTLPREGGMVSGNGTYDMGSSRTVTATPNSGFIFENWTENGRVVSSSASYNFTINNNRNLVAHFRPNFMNRPGTPNSTPNGQNPNRRSSLALPQNSFRGTNQFQR